ncbi:MAG: hypothetical protein Q7T04_05710 [Dehalococcoidia bacterium]|nr:hypothetical protein [Dehalococcoidia bacterium]
MAQEKAPVQETRATYMIDPQWFEEHSRSLASLLAGRLCYNCKTKLEDNADATAEDLFSSMKECCAQAEQFLESGLPLQEAVFRLLLKEGNRPMDLEEIYSKIRDWLMANRDNRLVSTEIMERILQSDRYYGFRRVETGNEKQD